MKKLIYAFALAVFMLASCNNDEVTIQPEVTKALTPEQQKMRSALETTTNILLNMITNDRTYLEELNKVIVAGSPEYLEDRVMLKDLFDKVSNSSALRVKANTNKFTSDFKTAFSNNKPQKIRGIDGVNTTIFTNPDSLIQFLTENNVSLYCPVPLNDYELNNRVPTITFHPIDNDSINTGFLLKSDGSLSSVVVSQEYNEKKPVWVIMPNDKGAYCETNNNVGLVNSNGFKSKNVTDTIFEVKLGQIYCKDYCSHFFEGTYIELHILRSLTTSIIDPANWKATGTFSNAISVKLNKKYVTYARNGWEKGWYTVNAVYDSNWSKDKTQQVLAIYEQDPTGDLKITGNAKFTLNEELSMKDEKTGITYTLKRGAEITAGCESNIKCKNDLIGVLEMNRDWFMRTLKIDNGNRFRGSAFRNGYGIQALSNDFWYTMELRKL